MLSFYDAAWASARDRAATGRRADALAHLAPLLTGTDVPNRLRLLAHRLAARVHHAAGRYRKARKHLYEAARLSPNAAEVHYEIGLAFEADPYGCDRRAARRYRTAVALDGSKPRFRAALGRALVRIDRVPAGVKQLTAAAAAAPADSAVLKVVVDGLCDAGRVRLAGRIVAKARFLAPADKAVRKLWDEVRFAAARRVQARGATVGIGPRMLPFVRVVGGEPRPAAGGGVVRADGGSRTAPHLGRLRAYRAGQG
jgi:Flp pilus assembly protein TadD